MKERVKVISRIALFGIVVFIANMLCGFAIYNFYCVLFNDYVTGIWVTITMFMVQCVALCILTEKVNESLSNEESRRKALKILYRDTYIGLIIISILLYIISNGILT